MSKTMQKGHIAAACTILIWGTTFISTKVLLQDFTPIEILFYRFLIGYIVLSVLSRRMLPIGNHRQELTMFAAGFCGICLYYLLENIALTYTLASNVGVIISIAPFFTALITHFFMREEGSLQLSFFIGFIVAMVGICMMSFQDSFAINPLGDMLAILAAFVWACYSVLTRKISGFGYPVLQTTKRIFFYGLLCMLPCLVLFDFQWELTRFLNPIDVGNIVFLGIGASALCFVTWNSAVQILGAVKTSVYIYAVPVITIVTSFLILQETVTLQAGIGTIFTLAGLWISERR